MSIDLGFALHPKWIEGTTLDEFFTPLKAAGMDVLEFTLHPADDEWEAMQSLAEECVRVGYRCHFHAPYQDPFNPDGFASVRCAELQQLYLPALEFAERMARQGSRAPALVIHGAHGKGVLAQLAEDTRVFLAWVLKQTQHSRVMLENLPPKNGNVRVGETYEQIVSLVSELNHPRLAACWDFGHSVLQGRTDLPPNEFLRAVRHVHIHDINNAREDHFPLIFGNVPWQNDLRALMRVGFDGAVVMEINGYRAQNVERLHERLAESFAAMREIVKPNEDSST